MRPRVNRAIKPEEIAVIESALERAPVSPPVLTIRPGLASLRVVGVCGCGCDSIDFTRDDPSHISTPVADGLGTTPAGGQVGIIVWGISGAITGLEIYDMGAGDDDLRLPLPASIRPLVIETA
jgi:hypothetical protein